MKQITKYQKRLPKKYKYRLGICSGCEKPILAREQTKSERKKYSKELGEDATSKFDHTALIKIKSFCDCGVDYLLNIPYSYEKAQELYAKH